MSGSDTPAPGAPAPDAPSTGGPATEVIAVPEVHCDHCVRSIEGALAPVPGVHDVRVDLSAKQVTVTHDDEVTRGRLVELIEAQGYEVP